MPERITGCKRPIAMIGVEHEFGFYARVGSKGVTKIIAYDEAGEMAPVPWLAVYKGDKLWNRIAARHVRIEYDTEAPDLEDEVLF